jgi:hypothetical protein
MIDVRYYPGGTEHKHQIASVRIDDLLAEAQNRDVLNTKQ